VAAELVGVGDGLLEREGRVRGAVHAQGGGAAGREEGRRGRGEREDLGWVGFVHRVRGEVLFRLRGQC
jgi:hypothetical protein